MLFADSYPHILTHTHTLHMITYSHIAYDEQHIADPLCEKMPFLRLSFTACDYAEANVMLLVI